MYQIQEDNGFNVWSEQDQEILMSFETREEAEEYVEELKDAYFKAAGEELLGFDISEVINEARPNNLFIMDTIDHSEIDQICNEANEGRNKRWNSRLRVFIEDSSTGWTPTQRDRKMTQQEYRESVQWVASSERYSRKREKKAQPSSDQVAWAKKLRNAVN